MYGVFFCKFESQYYEMKKQFIIFLILLTSLGFSQEITQDSVAIQVDSLYREDQFYTNITYNALVNIPDNLKQNKFSTGLSLGFLRDMPINKNRTYSVAIGAGYSYSAYNHNLYQYNIINANNQNQNVYETISDNTSYNENRQSMHFVDFPLELRWRNSTPNSHKFWRVYTGFKVSYLFSDTYKFVNSLQTVVIKNNPDLNKWQYGVYLTSGWNTWNLYIYYGLNGLYKDIKIDNKTANLQTLNIGLQFYIL
ncbi:MAG: hypothetical protein ACI9XR_001413 [Flavobacterium sp.]|jgi:hypothetical protein